MTDKTIDPFEEKLATGIKIVVDNNKKYQDILNSIDSSEITHWFCENHIDIMRPLVSFENNGLKAVYTHTTTFLSDKNRIRVPSSAAFDHIKISCRTPEYIRSVTLFMQFSIDDKKPISYEYIPLKKLTSTDDTPFTSNLFRFYNNPIPTFVMVYTPLYVEVEFIKDYPLSFTDKVNSVDIVGVIYNNQIESNIYSTSDDFNNVFD